MAEPGIEWEDVGILSVGEKDRILKSSEVKIGPFRLVLHRHIDYGPNEWLATCHPDIFRCELIPTDDISEAKRIAVTMLKDVLGKALYVIERGEK